MLYYIYISYCISYYIYILCHILHIIYHILYILQNGRFPFTLRFPCGLSRPEEASWTLRGVRHKRQRQKSPADFWPASTKNWSFFPSQCNHQSNKDGGPNSHFDVTQKKDGKGIDRYFEAFFLFHFRGDHCIHHCSMLYPIIACWLDEKSSTLKRIIIMIPH